jgi:EmrB/QacA subfamily drug resistance transporter
MKSRSTSASAAVKRKEIPQADDMPRYSRRDTLLTMCGVLMVMLLGSLDQTVVSTAMPHVIADLHGFDRYTWVSTAYLLTSTVMVPIYGKLSDQFGRKIIFLFGLVVFLTGSALSGAAQSMNELILFRAFQGIGDGALLPIAVAVVGDLFTPRERGKWQGVTGAVFGLSAIVGPVLGGWITQNSSWRWVFYVNLPVGIAAFMVLLLLMPTLRGTSKNVKIDYVGAALLVVGTIPLLLGFTFAGVQYAWLSGQVLGLFALSLAGYITFVLYEAWLERAGGQPIIEPSLFKNSIFTISSIVTFIFGMGLFGSVFFIPLFVQGVIGTSATSSGLILTPLMLTSVVSSILSGQLVSRLGKYKWIAIVGMLFMVAGSFLLFRLDVNATNSAVLLAMLVLGFGMGFGMSLYTLISQNAMPKKIGQTTSALVFFRSIGGTIALAAMGSVMNSAYLPSFTSSLTSGLSKVPVAASTKHSIFAQFLSIFNNPQILLSPGVLATMHAKAAAQGPQSVALLNMAVESVKYGLAQGLHNVFVLSMVIMIAGLIAVLFLKEIQLRGKQTSSVEVPTVDAVESFVPSESEAVLA